MAKTSRYSSDLFNNDNAAARENHRRELAHAVRMADIEDLEDTEEEEDDDDEEDEEDEEDEDDEDEEEEQEDIDE